MILVSAFRAWQRGSRQLPSSDIQLMWREDKYTPLVPTEEGLIDIPGVPSQPLKNYESEELLKKLGIDTLMFIFFYQTVSGFHQ